MLKLIIDKIYAGSKNDLLLNLEMSLKKQKKKYLVTINSELFQHVDNETISSGLTDEDTTIVVDGISVIKMLDSVGHFGITKIPGVEIVEDLLKISNENAFKLATYGCTSDVVEMFRETIRNKYPRIEYSAALDGFSHDIEDAFEKIRKEKPDLILIALGVPRQEKAIFENGNKFDKGIFIGCGGSIDVLSGSKKRAPIIFQKLNIEWFYRAAKEPFRFTRYYKGGLALLKVRKKVK